MLVTEVPGTPDPSLPLLVPALPNPVDRRWVADTLGTDGATASWTDILASVVAAQATGANQPVAGTVDGLRGLTFDGSNDRLDTGVDLSAVNLITFYAVLKLTTLPSALRLVVDAGGTFLSINASNKWGAGAAANGALAPTTVVADKWYAVGISAINGTDGAETTRVVTSVDTAGAETTNATINSPLTTTAKIGSTSLCPSMVLREVSMKLGTAHTLTQLAANVAALKAEYGLT